MIERLMYHHHIINRDNEEIIKKIFRKQEESPCKDDSYKNRLWIHGGTDKSKLYISTSKEDYSKYIKDKAQGKAFKSYPQLKGQSKKKMKDLQFDKLTIQNYLVSDQFSLVEKYFLSSLGSMCYPAEMNFWKLHKGNLKSSLKCDKVETQLHIFQACIPILARLDFIQ